MIRKEEKACLASEAFVHRVDHKQRIEIEVLDDVSHGWLPEQYYRSKEAKLDDPIIVPMLEIGWGLYDPNGRQKLIGSDKLSDEALKIIARCILFLQSDKEYEWPYFDTKFNFSLLEFIVA